MRSSKNNGQEAVEFILISVLVFFAAFLTIITFGDKIAAFFTTDSAVAKSAKASSPTISANSQPNYTPDYQTSIPVETANIAGYTVTKNDDGSMSFQVAGQDVTLPSSMLSLQDTVFETTGSSSKENLLKEIAYMIETHKNEYPGTNVPVEIVYGKGKRSWTIDDDTYYAGNAVANSATIKVGNHVVITQNDQEFKAACSVAGVYRIEGTLDSSNNLKGKVTGENKDQGYVYAGDFEASNFNANDKTKGFFNNFTYNNNSPGWTYDWELDFSNPDYAYKL